MTRRSVGWTVAVLIAGLIAVVLAKNRHAELRQAEADFQWFSTLGFPDVRGCRFARIATGAGFRLGNDPPQNHYANAFILGTNRDEFTMMSLALVVSTKTNTPPGTPEHIRVGYEAVDLKSAAADWLRRLQTPLEPGPISFGSENQAPEQVETFTLAWACWRKGSHSEAYKLYGEARVLPRKQSLAGNKRTLSEWYRMVAQTVQDKWHRLASGSQATRPATLRESLEKELAHALIWRAVVAFGNPSISRSQLLVQFDAIATNYPRSEYRQRAQDTGKVLRRMIAEDLAHQPVPAESLAQLPVEERVRELIFQLRDQNGYQFSQPGSCDIFMNPHGLTNTPAHQLVSLGYAAVPQLIEVLDSDTLTRSVDFHRDFYFSHDVLKVGDCAATILHRITGRSVFFFRPADASSSTNSSPSPGRQRAGLWWAEFQHKGEQQMLTEGVVAGDDDAADQGSILAQRYPDGACEALARGARNATNTWIRTQLIEQIAKLDQAEGRQFLDGELWNGPTLESRVAAAYGLLTRQRATALAAMIDEWGRFTRPTGEDESAWERLVDFLAHRDSVEALSALGKDLRRRPLRVRVKVIESLGDTNDWVFDHPVEAPSEAVLGGIESILAAALEDSERQFGASYSWGDKSFSDPRICDLAGYFLSMRWPSRYGLDITESWKMRERQRVTCLNTWRKAHGLGALAMPQGPSAKLSPGEATKVTMVEWSADGATPNSEFAADISALRNKRLKAADLMRLLSEFASHPPSNAAGLEMHVEKDRDLTGVYLRLRLVPGQPPTQSQGWNISERVVLGTKDLYNCAGGGSNWYTDAEGNGGLAAAIRQAIAGPAETAFEISVRVVRSGTD